MNYGDIKTHFEALLNRSDITPTLTTNFIDQSIARIQRSLRTPLNESVKTHTLTTLTPSIALPNDFLETISLYFGSHELKNIPMVKYRQLAASTYTGNPVYYTRQQQDILLFPQPSSGDLVLYYYSTFPAMVLNTDENALAAVASDLIIYGALAYAADFYLDERAELFEIKFQTFLNELQEQSNDMELNGGTQSINPAYQYEG